jgi:hypothetical protein
MDTLQAHASHTAGSNIETCCKGNNVDFIDLAVFGLDAIFCEFSNLVAALL